MARTAAERAEHLKLAAYQPSDLNLGSQSDGGDAHHDRPSTVRKCLRGLPKGLGAPNRLKSDIRASAIGQLARDLDGVVARGVDHFGRSEVPGQLKLVVADVDRNDLAGTDGARDLDHTAADTARAEDRDRLVALQTPNLSDSSIGGHEGTSEDRRIGELKAVVQRRDAARRDDSLLAQPAHGVHPDGLAVGIEQPCLAVVERAVEAVVGEEEIAELLAATTTHRAGSAWHDERPDNPLPDLQVGDPFTELEHSSRDLVTEHARQREGDGSVVNVQIGVADAARCDAHEDFAGSRFRVAKLLDLKGSGALADDGSSHRVSPVAIGCEAVIMATRFPVGEGQVYVATLRPGGCPYRCFVYSAPEHVQTRVPRMSTSIDAGTDVTNETSASHEPRLVSHWIDAAAYEKHSDRRTDVLNPATGLRTATVALADGAVVDAAVQSASAALPAWRDTALSRRLPILQRFRALLMAHTDELAAIIASEHGKIHDDAAGEVQRGLEVVDLACAAPIMLKGEYSDQVATGIDTYSLRQPVGVCVGITPFNFPAMVPLWMFPIAIACGNTFVLKPSERDPSASVLLAQLAAEAGLPPGVLNVVHGDKAAVDLLLDHPAVSAVSFVGSTTVARHIYERAAANGKRVQALGGAKNHMVVLPDADLESAADAAVSAAFGSAGQRCMAVSVVVAVGDIGDGLVSAIAERAGRLRVGPAADAASEMGPVITAQARERVIDYIGRGASAGAEVAVDGRDLPVDAHRDGNFVGPSVLDNVSPGMDVYQDEVFGPLLTVVRAQGFDEALELIAENPYGNGAAIFTASGAAARRFVREVEAGMVGVNVPIPVPVGFYSFGGWGDSLFGDTHVYGPESFHFYTRSKVVTSRWPKDTSGVRLAFPSG